MNTPSSQTILLHTASESHRLHIRLANTFFTRFHGLMFCPNLALDQGLLLVDCSSIHTLFMRFPIDVVYLDEHGFVTQCVPHLKPWRASNGAPATVHTLELAAGSIERLDIRIGNRLFHPYFQISRLCIASRPPIPLKQRGSAMLEFVWAGPMITLIGLGILQYGLLFFAKNQMNHATFMAARAGSMGHASLQTVTDTYIKALIPLYGGGRSSEELAAAYAKAHEDISGHMRIELLNPTKESFDDWSNPALQNTVGNGHRVIPNGSLPFKKLTDIRSASGQNIYDANLIKIRITHGYLPKVPLMRMIYTQYLRVFDPGTDTFQTQLIAEGRIPVVTHVTLKMESDAIESDNPISLPGPGNAGNPSDPGDPPSVDADTPNCLTFGCTVENPSSPPLGLGSPGDGACDSAISCCTPDLN